VSFLLTQLIAGLRLTGSASVAYFSSAVLVTLALIPASLRTFQLFTGEDNGWLEILVELLRLVLVATMIMLGRGWKVADLLRTIQWAAVGRDIATAWRSGWLGILLQLTVVTAVILFFNAVVEFVVTTPRTTSLLIALGLDPAAAAPTTIAAIFAVKNIVVIPVYLMSMLQALIITDRRRC